MKIFNWHFKEKRAKWHHLAIYIIPFCGMCYFQQRLNSGSKLAIHKSWFTDHNSQINFVFSQITLSNFLWNLQIKTFLLLEFLFSGKPEFLFTLQAQQFAYILLQKVLNSTLFSCIWIAFWSQTRNGEAYNAPPYPLAVGTTQ